MATMQLKCKKCKHVNDYPTEDLDWECISQDERQMGSEYNYISKIDFICDKCGKTITGELSYWEYPEGTINHHETELTGATLISDEDAIYEATDYSDDDNSEE